MFVFMFICIKKQKFFKRKIFFIAHADNLSTKINRKNNLNLKLLSDQNSNNVYICISLHSIFDVLIIGTEKQKLSDN